MDEEYRFGMKGVFLALKGKSSTQVKLQTHVEEDLLFPIHRHC